MVRLRHTRRPREATKEWAPPMAESLRSNLSYTEINEEVAFFRDYCGWSEPRIEKHLGLAHGTLAQRRLREKKKTNTDA